MVHDNDLLKLLNELRVNLTMSIKCILSHIRNVGTSRKLAFVARSFGSSNNMKKNYDDVSFNSGIAVLRMNNPPANSLNFKFMERLIWTIKSLEDDAACGAIILTSALPNIFCVGLDFKEIYKPEKDRLLKFLLTFQDLFIAIFGSKLPIIAAINGSGIAGGCILPLGCDYRIMMAGDNFKIGVNEVHMGIPLTSWLADIVVNVVGLRHAELAITSGHSYNAAGALAIGLIDEMVPNNEVLLSRAQEKAQMFAALPKEARHLSKMFLRQPLLDSMEATRDQQAEKICEGILSKTVQATLENHIKNLKLRKTTKSNF